MGNELRRNEKQILIRKLEGKIPSGTSGRIW
jgi:hypothetical protein